MPDIDRLAQALFGGKRAESQEVATDATTRTYIGTATSDSEDGTVTVDLGGDVTLPDDMDGVEYGASGVEVSTGPGVRAGDEVIVTLVGGGPLKTPMVTGVAGEGDRQNVRIGAIEADYVKATELEADVADIGFLKADSATITDLQADAAKVHSLTAEQLSAATGYVGELQAGSVSAQDIVAGKATVGQLAADHVSVSDFTAEQANIDSLQAATADIATIRANSAKVANLTAAELEADHATIGSLDTNYAQVNLANVDNAWIENGTVKDGAITNAMINSVSANKLTAGTIDASNINVTNLNADNLTAGTINGQRIGEGSLSLSKLEDDVYTESEVDGKLATMQAEIDGAIETWTGTEVPTLSNTPASGWTTADERDRHVGDVYFVVNSQSQQNGYNYRFTKTGSTYSWQLIKDNDVTNALQRLTTAEGKITTFDSDISTLQTDTGTLKTKTQSLETSLGDKVDVTTFNSLEDTVDGHTQTLSQHTTAISNKADSSTVTAVTNRVSKNEQDISGLTTSVGQLQTTVATKADNSTVETVSNNLSTLQQDVNGYKTTVASTYATKEALSDAQSDLQDAIDTKAASSDLTALTTRVSTAESTIEQHSGSIALKANSADVYTKQQSDGLISTEVTNRNAAISAATDAINLSVSQTYTTKTEFNELEIGGRNLLVNSAVPLPTLSPFNNSTLQIYNMKLDGIDYYYCSGARYWRVDFPSLVSGDTYNLWFDIARSSDTRTVYVKIGDVEKSVGNAPAQAWARLGLSFVATDATYAEIRVAFNSSSTTTTYIAALKNIKLERGTKPTDWTPAPEDMASQADLTEAKAAIKVTTDGISTEVSKKADSATIISTIRQSAETVKIKASQVEIDGTAVFNAISDDVDDAITSKGYQTSSQVNSAITSKGYATTTQAQGYATTAKTEAISAAATDATKKANAVQTNLDNLQIGGRNLFPYSEMKEYYGGALRAAGSYYSVVDDEIVATSQPERGPLPGWKIDNGTYIVSGTTSLSSVVIYVQGYDSSNQRVGSQKFASKTVNSNGYFERTIDDLILEGVSYFYIGVGANSIQDYTIKPKLEKGNKATDWTPAPEDTDASIATVQGNLNATRSWYATSSTVAETAVKVAAITPATTDFTLNVGTIVNVEFTATNTAAVANLKLNVNGTGEKSIKYMYNNTRSNLPAVGYLVAGIVYQFMYDGEYWTIQNIHYNTNDNYNARQVQYYNTIKAGEALPANYIIGAHEDGLFYKMAGESTYFILSAPLLWLTAKLNADATDYSHIFIQVNDRNLNTIYASFSGVANSIVYLVGTIDGNRFTPYGATSATYLTCTIPTTEDGLFYIPIGKLGNQWNKNAYFNYQVSSPVSIFAFIDGKFRQVTPTDIVASHRIYYRTQTASSTLAAPTAWVEEATGNVYNQWTTKVPPMAASTAAGQTKYLYLYTCEQRKRLDGTTVCTKVLLDENTTVIDGGQIITHSITANQIAANTITANEIDATDLHVSAANIDGTLTASQINASGLTIGQSQVTGLTTALNDKADTSDIPTNVSDLANDSGFQTSSQVESAITGKGYQTSSQVESAITSKGYQTSSQVESAITGKGYQTSTQVESAITSKGYATTTQAQGYADTAEANAKAAIPTDVSDLTNDAGYITDAAIPANNNLFGTCSTAAGTTNKTVVCSNVGSTVPVGTMLTFTSSTASTVAAPKIVIANSDNETVLAALPIWVNNAVAASANPVLWTAKATLTLVLQGTYWEVTDKPGSFSATSSSNATAVAKAASLTGAPILEGTVVAVTFSNANTISSAITLNVGSTGAVSIRFNNAAVSASNTINWKNGATVTFIRRSAYWYVADSGAIRLADDAAYAASEAAQVATNYLTTVDSTGLMVHRSSDSTTGVKVTDSVDIMRNGVSTANFGGTNGDSARLGTEAGNHVLIDSDSVDIVDGASTLATFGADETHLGMSGAGKIYMADDTFQMSATTSEWETSTSNPLKHVTQEAVLNSTMAEQVLTSNCNIRMTNEQEVNEGDSGGANVYIGAGIGPTGAHDPQDDVYGAIEVSADLDGGSCISLISDQLAVGQSNIPIERAGISLRNPVTTYTGASGTTTATAQGWRLTYFNTVVSSVGDPHTYDYTFSNGTITALRDCVLEISGVMHWLDTVVGMHGFGIFASGTAGSGTEHSVFQTWNQTQNAHKSVVFPPKVFSLSSGGQLTFARYDIVNAIYTNGANYSWVTIKVIG